MGQVPAGRKAPGAEERSWEQAARLTRQQETREVAETEGGFSGADARKGHTGPERLRKVCPMLESKAWEPLTQMLPSRKKERGERETGQSPEPLRRREHRKRRTEPWLHPTGPGTEFLSLWLHPEGGMQRTVSSGL